MKIDDPVRSFLQERGCPDSVVRRGLRGLVEAWERTVREVRAGYPLGLDDYLNDMDGRQLIEDVFRTIPVAHTPTLAGRVREADALLRQHLQPAQECLWGAETATSRGWTPEKQWWYFQRPKKAGPELMAELPADEGRPPRPR